METSSDAASSRGHYDLIVTDLNMADIRGLERESAIRRAGTPRDVPLIIISTQTTKSDVTTATSRSARTRTVKNPFTPELRGSCRSS